MRLRIQVGTQEFEFGLNLLMLWVLVALWRWPHQLVQALAIVAVAGLLYGLNRHWVCAQSRRAGA